MDGNDEGDRANRIEEEAREDNPEATTTSLRPKVDDTEYAADCKASGY